MIKFKCFGVGYLETDLVAVGKGLSFKDFYSELTNCGKLCDKPYNIYEINEDKYNELLVDDKVRKI